MERAWIGLGGNVGDVAATFEGALARLDDHPAIRVVARSGPYGTTPIGEYAGGTFRNMAAGLETSLPPHDLLATLHEVEAAFGRVREIVWGPRTLDLDLLLFGDHVIADDRLVVPHPAAWYRRFVLDPLAEIAADVMHPERGVTIGELQRRFDVRPLPLAVVGDAAIHAEIIMSLRKEFEPDVVFVEPSADPAIVAWLGGEPGFDSLPRSSRLDASRSDPTEFLQNVVASALG